MLCYASISLYPMLVCSCRGFAMTMRKYLACTNKGVEGG